MGFLRDTPASVVFQATNLLRSACASVKEGGTAKKGKREDIFKWSQLDPGNYCIEESQQHWRDSVSWNINYFDIIGWHHTWKLLCYCRDS